tara:strand:- start:39 stop:401 length:363 start_codon:yes stop_codon:yes gene_type:complete
MRYLLIFFTALSLNFINSDENLEKEITQESYCNIYASYPGRKIIGDYNFDKIVWYGIEDCNEGTLVRYTSNPFISNHSFIIRHCDINKKILVFEPPNKRATIICTFVKERVSLNKVENLD